VKIVRNVEQGSWDWMRLRAGKVCGSELKYLITDKLAVRGWKTDMPNSYLYRKLDEKWIGGPREAFAGNRQTDQGTLSEPVARKYFASLLDTDIETVGGIESDDGRCWVSPDGLVNSQTGLEIKCPNGEKFIGWLLNGPHVPPEHILQVQFGLYISGWPSWWFLAYCKSYPHLAVPVEHNPTIAATIKEALYGFNDRFDEAWKILCEKNGGPPEPPQKKEPTQERPLFSWDQGAVNESDDSSQGIIP